MAEGLIPAVWRQRALFAVLAALLMVVQMLPLSAGAGGVPGPDLLLCLAVAWVLRRPAFVPALLIAAVFLLQDMLVMRPPGVWAATVLVGCEFLRGRSRAARDMPFVAEWGLVGGVMLAMMLANRFVLLVAMVPQPGLGPVLVQLVLTFSAYPAVAFVSQTVFRVRKAAPGSGDIRGRLT